MPDTKRESSTGRIPFLGFAEALALRLACELTDGRSQSFGLLQLRLSGDVPDVHVAAGIDDAAILPAEALQQRVIIVAHRLEVAFRVSLGGHQQDAVLDGVLVTRRKFHDGEQPVEGALQLAAEAPVVHGRRQNDEVGVLVVRINRVHVVLLDAGAFRILPAAATAETGMDVHLAHVEAHDSVSGLLRAFRKRFNQCGRVAAGTGTPVQNDDFLGHDCLLWFGGSDYNIPQGGTCLQGILKCTQKMKYAHLCEMLTQRKA